MKDEYVKTNWIDGKTPVNSENLSKIEDAIEELYEESIGLSQVKSGKGIKIDLDHNQELKFSANPEEINGMIKHNEYVEGHGIIMHKKLPIHTDDEDVDHRFDEFWDKSDPNKTGYHHHHIPLPPPPPTLIQTDDFYINTVIKHDKYVGYDGVVITEMARELPDAKKHECLPHHPHRPTLKDYIPPKFSVSLDTEYVNDIVRHPEYHEGDGIIINPADLEIIFPEGEFNEKEIHKVIAVDEEWVNDIIDVDRLAKKLNISPITEYVAGEGIIIGDLEEKEEDVKNEELENGDAEDIDRESNEGSDFSINTYTINTFSSGISGEDDGRPEEEVGSVPGEVEEPIKKNEVERVYKEVKLDEEFFKEKVDDEVKKLLPVLQVTDGLTLEDSRDTDPDIVPPVVTLSPDPEKLIDLLNITPHPELTVTDGLILNVTDPNNEEVEDKLPVQMELSLDSEKIKDLIGYTDHPEFTVSDGVVMTSSETVDEDGRIKQSYNFSLDMDWINERVIHQTFILDGSSIVVEPNYQGSGKTKISVREQFIKNIIDETVVKTINALGLNEME